MTMTARKLHTLRFPRTQGHKFLRGALFLVALARSAGVALAVLGVAIAALLPSGTVAAQPTNTPPTASDGTVTTDEDTTYTFAAANFNYSDADGNPLASVTVVAVPANGALTLSGNTVNTNDVVSQSDIDAGNLVYTPPQDANGTNYTSFTFKVSDGTEESADTYTMTINVTAVNDAPTGRPVIFGKALVREWLTAVTLISDVDGLGLSGPFTYQWKRYASDGTTFEANLGTNRRYKLTANEEGKRVTVEVSFTDGGGTEEGPLASDVFPADSCVGSCPSSVTVTVQENSPAAGQPTISGTAQVGQTLTADTSEISDPDGLDNVSYSYQWLTSRDAEIEGETSSSYTLQSSDNGKVIKVQVTFTDDLGYEESLTSEGTAAVVMGGL